MSGDVQPRKRKDKKRRKDEPEPEPIKTTTPTLTNVTPNDDQNIHVHKEGGTGGGICAKLVFFILFSALSILIGLIITEHRGLTDVEVVERDSKFAQIFEGWTDSPSEHTEHDIHEAFDHDDHDEDDLAQDSAEDEHEDEEEDEDEEADLDEDESKEEEDLTEEVSNEDEEEEDVSEDQDEDEDEDEQEDEDTYEVSTERGRRSVEDEDEDEDKYDDKSDETLEEDRDDEDADEDEDEEKKEEDDRDDEDADEDEDEEKKQEEDDDYYERGHQVEKRSIEDNLSGEDKEDDHPDDDEEHENDNDEEVQPQKVNTVEEDDKIKPGDEVQQSSGMAVKLGVGVALLVVAHLVLVRKWRTAPEEKPSKREEEKEPTPDLTRRNTIVMPPSLQEVEPDIEQDEEEYSEEELSDEEVKNEPRTAKERYTELRTKYSRSFSPDEDRRSPVNYEDEEDEEELSEEEVDEEDEEVDDEELLDEDESENDDYDEEENEELLKRLEARYGKLPGQAPESKEGTDITNKDDVKIKEEIDEAQKFVENNPAYAVQLFDKILQKYPSSPRSLYGKAIALDNMADQKRSNEILYKALDLYTQLLMTDNIPETLVKITSERCIKRMRFVGQYWKLVDVQKAVIKKFPDDPKHRNDLVITYLMMNRIEQARSVLTETLEMWPGNGVALVHYGFILKTTDNKLEAAVHYLKKGLQTNDEGVVDGRFYFHLGDALARLGQHNEAMEVYEQGTKNKVFLSKYQRSLYNVDRLTGKPFWDLDDLPFVDLFKHLKQYWKKIREEGLSVLNEKGYFQDEAENLRDTGEWKQFELYVRGQKNVKNCRKTPFTCSIIDQIPEVKGCKRGQTKFSVMHPGTHVWPHCGPTNCRLRIHLGLKVPPKTFLRVATETRSWKEGEILAFDDSFEHEVWHNGTNPRLVLIVDVWHPELTATEKKNLSPI